MEELFEMEYGNIYTNIFLIALSELLGTVTVSSIFWKFYLFFICVFQQQQVLRPESFW